VRAVGEKTFNPRFCFRHGVGRGDAGNVEAARMRVLNQRGFGLKRIVQKSRLA
jgi:hypothetical protein